MGKYLIITNNPLVQERVAHDIDFYQTLTEVIKQTRDLVHQGYKLVTHPLSGSVKPVQNPYKSIILSSQQQKLDYKSLEIIEHTITKVKQFRQDQTERNYPQSVKEDYQLIDLSLLESGLNNLNKGGKK